MSVFGTRPEAIKMAPLIKKLKNNKNFEVTIVVTAQHREMLDQVLDLFGIETNYDLDIMKKNQSLSDITSRVLKGLERIYKKENPDLVLVHGDTSTTFVGALASFYNKIKVAHIEAGLRTHEKYSPFPEEINRHLTGVLADFHFAPTESTYNNLIKENVSKDNIFITGNTVIDALYEIRDPDFEFSQAELKNINFNKRKVLLLTSHRRENLGKPMENIFMAVKRLILKNKDVEVIFPVHLNPRVRKIANKIFADIDRIHLIEPLDYKPFINLMDRSYLILTDSGGIQEEAPSLAKPVLVLRDTTERPEAVEAGTVLKVGTNTRKIYQQSLKLLTNTEEYKKRAAAVNPYGDGRAVGRIIRAIDFYFGINKTRPDDFEV